MLFVVCVVSLRKFYILSYHLLHYFDSYTLALFLAPLAIFQNHFLWEKVCHYLPGDKGGRGERFNKLVTNGDKGG